MISQKIQAIIVAGGTGVRMGNQTPKQFIIINGKPIIQWTLESFIAVYNEIEIIIVINKDYIDKLKNIIKPLPFYSKITIVKGGETRFHSVKNGVEKIHKNAIVFVHDAVRCIVTKSMLERCFEGAMKYGNAIPAISMKDSVRIEENQKFKSLNRNKIKIIQTPQTFQSNILKDIFQQEYQEIFTDEATVAEHKGYNINLVEGEQNNIKVTYPLDLILAEGLLKQ